VPVIALVDMPQGNLSALEVPPTASVEMAAGDVPIVSTLLVQAATTPTEATLMAILGLMPAVKVGHCCADPMAVTVEPTTDMTPPPLQPM